MLRYGREFAKLTHSLREEATAGLRVSPATARAQLFARHGSVVPRARPGPISGRGTRLVRLAGHQANSSTRRGGAHSHSRARLQLIGGACGVHGLPRQTERLITDRLESK